MDSAAVLEFDALKEKKNKLKLFAQTCGCSRERHWLILAALKETKAKPIRYHVLLYNTVPLARAQYRDTNAEPSGGEVRQLVHCPLSG